MMNDAAYGTLAHFNDWLIDRVSDNNRRACVRVMRRLMAGQGVTHINKPGEVFYQGYHVTIDDDIPAIRAEAFAWLPPSGPNVLDGGHGWALNQPLGWFIRYKNEHGP